MNRTSIRTILRCIGELAFVVASTSLFPFVRAADDHGDTPETATTVAVGSVTAGALETAGDKDHFRFTVVNAGLYVIYSRSRIDTLGYLFDPNTGSSGEWVSDSNSGEDANFRIVRTLKPGTHYVAVSGEYRDRTGAYQLHIEGPGAGTVSDDHGFSIWSATPVTAGSITPGELGLSGDD